MDKTLLQSENGFITKNNIIRTLKEVGLQVGDIVMVHSRMFTLGKLADVKNKEDVLNSFIDSLLEVVGDQGTLIFPTFTLLVCKKGLFDVDNTKSEMGVLSEAARIRADSSRTAHPIYSVVIIGKDKELFLNANITTCFGENSVFDLFHKENNSSKNKNKL